MKTYYKAGSWNAVCDVCGFRFKAHELRKRWDGLMTCSKDYELDHPQKYLRITPDNQSVPFVKKEQELFVQMCTLATSSAYADVGTADCLKADSAVYPYANLQSVIPRGTF